MVLAIIAMLWGLYAIYRAWQTKQDPVLQLDLPPDSKDIKDFNGVKNSTDISGVTNGNANKDDVPVVPRHKRQFTDTNTPKISSESTEENAQTLADATSSTTDKATQVVTASVTDKAMSATSDKVALTTQAGTVTTITADGDMYVSVTPKNEITVPQPAQEMTRSVTDNALTKKPSSNLMETDTPAHPNEPDAFSALANATQAITPVVHTYDESQLKSDIFSQNSPILDSHIQAQIDHEQNSPLHNAEQNINISIFPRQSLQRFAGKDLLGLVDKYGLKYGAMNMFHRYENKDGTGILWFSMMMVESQVPSAFDLNKLPLQHLDGLILFLSLPHPEAGQAFESMISMAKMMANDLNAELYDDVGEPLSPDSVALLKSIAVLYGTQPE